MLTISPAKEYDLALKKGESLVIHLTASDSGVQVLENWGQWSIRLLPLLPYLLLSGVIFTCCRFVLKIFSKNT